MIEKRKLPERMKRRGERRMRKENTGGGALLPETTTISRAGNMGRVRWAGPNWPDILKGRAMKLVARIKSEPIGPTRIGPQPIRVRAGPTLLARIFFKKF